MEWFFIEALVALAVAIGIVWWTMAPQKKRGGKSSAAPKDSP